MHKRWLIATALAAIAAAAAAAPAAAQEDVERLIAGMQSYRGEYELRQVKSAARGPAVAVSGRMATEARIGCKAFESATSMTLRFAGPGRAIELMLESKVHESRDGRSFRNSMRVFQDGQETRRHEAEAVLQTRDGPGQGVVKRGAPETLKLQRGTVLPGTHYMRAIAAAAAGKSEAKHRVYIGEDDIRLADITTTVTGSGTAPANAVLGDFAGQPGWSFREVLRGVAAPGSDPRVTDTFVTREGVLTSMSITVQGVELASKVVKIEKLAKPTCP